MAYDYTIFKAFDGYENGYSANETYESFLAINNFIFQPFFSIRTTDRKIISSGQIIDGDQIFERMSYQAARISLSGAIYLSADVGQKYDPIEAIKTQFEELKSSGWIMNAQASSEDLGDVAMFSKYNTILDILYTKIFRSDMVIPIYNPYLAGRNIEQVIVESINTEPIQGRMGFTYRVEMYEARDSQETLFVTQD